MAINTAIAGRKFGFLTTAYTDERARKIVCYCACSRQVHVAAADLANGAVTSCGCQPPPPAFWAQYTELRTLQRREITFNVAKGR